MKIPNKTKFTADQIEHYLAYEAVRKSGKYNMLMDQTSARLTAGLDRDEYAFVINNYEELMKAVKEAE